MSTPSVTMSDPASQPGPAPQAPLAELLPSGAARAFALVAMATAVVASFVDFGVHGHAFIGAIFCPVLILLAAIDVKHRLLPNAIILPASLAVGVIVAASSPGGFLTHLGAGAALGGFFFVFGTVFAGSIGMGDAKLGFLIGLALGSRTLDATLIAFATLLVAALYVLARRGVSARKDTLAFGPFLALGGILAFFLS